jgi:UDPglucose--hexose-1-phosphate uridylyltransferase
MNSEIRKHYFLDRYVIIAPKRNRRPHKILRKDEDQLVECFFCPPRIDQNEVSILEVKGEDHKWLIKVIENKFPALTIDNLKAYGKQEIIVETPSHNTELQDLSLEHIVKVIDVYIDRYKTLTALPGINYTIVFKNEGGKAGASIPHSHSQVIALPVIPPKLKEEAAAMDSYIYENGSCPYCDILKSEKGSSRVIFEDDHLFVLAPYASESPYGAWFIPKRHVHSIEFLHENEKMSLAHALKMVLKRLDDIDVSYNYFFQNSLDCESHHMVLKLEPRPNVWAGLELGTGVIINPVPPEEAAKFYRGERQS